MVIYKGESAQEFLNRLLDMAEQTTNLHKLAQQVGGSNSVLYYWRKKPPKSIEILLAIIREIDAGADRGVDAGADSAEISNQ